MELLCKILILAGVGLAAGDSSSSSSQASASASSSGEGFGNQPVTYRQRMDYPGSQGGYPGYGYGSPGYGIPGYPNSGYGNPGYGFPGYNPQIPSFSGPGRYPDLANVQRIILEQIDELKKLARTIVNNNVRDPQQNTGSGSGGYSSPGYGFDGSAGLGDRVGSGGYPSPSGYQPPGNNYTPGSGDGSVGAVASASIGPGGGYGSTKVFPSTGGSGLGDRFGPVNEASGAFPAPSGGPVGVSSFASSSSSDINGKKTSEKTATVSFNDNGKVTSYTSHDP